MTNQLIKVITPSVSDARLKRYSATGEIDRDALVSYLWNTSLAEALYSPLSFVEIALRNTLHATLSAQFGTPNWYHGSGLLEPAQRKDVFEVERRIRESGRSVTSDRVVSELSFGFWVTILSRNYDARFWSRDKAVMLRMAFPRVPRRYRQRSLIHHRFNSIRILRNRTFHHEPLFDDPKLFLRHKEMMESIRWINPDVLEIEKLVDRFEVVWNEGRRLIELGLNRSGRM